MKSKFCFSVLLFIFLIISDVKTGLAIDGLNAITFQPFGLLVIRTNAEFERYIGPAGDMAFSIAGRLNMSTQAIGISSIFKLNKETYPSTWFGFGGSARLYTDRKMKGYYAGINLDFMSGEVNYYNSKVNSESLIWLGIEIGNKYVLSRSDKGIVLTPSLLLLFGLSSSSDDAEDMMGIFYSIGFSAGYQF